MTLYRFFYSVVFYLLTPIIFVRLFCRALASPDYANRWAERLGFTTVSSAEDIIWVHAVSVGETLAAVPLVRELQKRYPAYRLMMTCMTPTGSERVRALFGESVEHSYAPYDMPGSVSRFLNTVKPKILIIMETELWPNTIAACERRNIPVVLANGRLSPGSAKAYQRIGPLVRPMLAALSMVAAQHSDDGARFVGLGLPADALQVTGNIKFDLTLDDTMQRQSAALSEQWHGADKRPVFLAASTHRGEDEIILDAFAGIRRQLGNTLLVLVPRHPERFNQVAELCASAGFSLARRSGLDAVADSDVLLGDSMGELMMFYGACDVAFVGGSLVPTGGHNMIEPAAWGVPVLTGPHLFNFNEASQLLLNGGALQICESADEMAQQCLALLQNQQRRERAGSAARLVAEANKGALDKLLMLIGRFI